MMKVISKDEGVRSHDEGDLKGCGYSHRGCFHRMKVISKDEGGLT